MKFWTRVEVAAGEALYVYLEFGALNLGEINSMQNTLLSKGKLLAGVDAFAFQEKEQSIRRQVQFLAGQR
jgi:hypothetical protein